MKSSPYQHFRIIESHEPHLIAMAETTSKTLRGIARSRHLPGTAAARYLVCSSGNITNEMIQEYIKRQGTDLKDHRAFTVE